MSTIALLLLASQAAAPPALTSNVCIATTVVAPGERSGRGAPSFSASDTLDLELQVQVRRVVVGDHLLRLKLLTPRGYLYQTMTIPFRFAAPAGDRNLETGAGTREAATRAPGAREDGRDATMVVPGFPRPLPVQTLGTTPRRRGGSPDAAIARLPVAGTSISLGSLFGQWTVVPYLDDETAPCGPPRTFEIRE